MCVLLIPFIFMLRIKHPFLILTPKTVHISSFVRWLKLAHFNGEWVHFHIERYGPLIFFLLVFHYLILYQSLKSELYHLSDIICHNMDMWHSSLIAGWLLLVFFLLQMRDFPLSHLGPLVTCYLLPWRSIARLQKSFVLVEIIFHLVKDMNLFLVIVEPCCHTWSPYNGAGKSVSWLAVYVPPWIGVLLYSFSKTVCKFCHYASVYSPILGLCLKNIFLPNPLIFHGNFWVLKPGALSVFCPHTPQQKHPL